MPTTETILLFLAASLPLALAPGPGMLYVVSRAAAQGRAAGVTSALSLSVGTLLHSAALALGLAALLVEVPAAYAVFRFAGAGYLVFLGVRLLRGSRARHDAGVAARTVPLRRVFLQGVVTGTLNPKVALFLAAFLPQFVDPARGSPALQILALGACFEALGASVHLVLAAITGSAAQRLLDARGARRWLERAAAAVFVGLGLRLALAGRR